MKKLYLDHEMQITSENIVINENGLAHVLFHDYPLPAGLLTIIHSFKQNLRPAWLLGPQA